MVQWSKEFLKESKDFWQKGYDAIGVKLTDADVEEICNNMINLFDCLAEVDQDTKKAGRDGGTHTVTLIN
jgi:hypothetical protein